MRKLGVVVAVTEEAKAILEDGSWAWSRVEPGVFRSGDGTVTLAISGIGKVFASYALTRILPASDLVLGLGTSGGLGDEPVGSLWLCPEFFERDMDCTALLCEPGLTPYSGMEGPVIRSAGAELLALAREAAREAGLEAGECRTASADSFVADPLLARAIRERTGSRLCDMESAALAKICAYRAKKEFLAFRAVSDNADHLSRRSWQEQVLLSSREFSVFLTSFVRRLNP